jgi:hypothetical protein
MSDFFILWTKTVQRVVRARGKMRDHVAGPLDYVEVRDQKTAGCGKESAALPKGLVPAIKNLQSCDGFEVILNRLLFDPPLVLCPKRFNYDRCDDCKGQRDQDFLRIVADEAS